MLAAVGSSAGSGAAEVVSAATMLGIESASTLVVIPAPGSVAEVPGASFSHMSAAVAEYEGLGGLGGGRLGPFVFYGMRNELMICPRKVCDMAEGEPFPRLWTFSYGA